MAQDPADGQNQVDVNIPDNADEIAEVTSKGPGDDEVCATCGEKIKDETGTFKAKYHNGSWYHDNSECVKDTICKKCNKVIDTTKGYFPAGPFHTDCYYATFGKCGGCGNTFDKSKDSVKDIRPTSKLGYWHRACFKCGECGKVIEESEYGMLKGQTIHTTCAPS